MFFKGLFVFLSSGLLIFNTFLAEESTPAPTNPPPQEEPQPTPPAPPNDPICQLPLVPPVETPSLPKVDPADLKDYVLAPFISEFEEFLPLKTGEALIVFKDHSRWIMRHFTQEDENLYLKNTWKKGDEIRLIKRQNLDRKGNFTLKNLRTKTEYPVIFDTSSLKNIIAYNIDKIDASGYFLSTNNKIDWEISWLDSWTSASWRPKDLILINKSDCSGKCQYLLFNLSTQEAILANIVEWK